MHLTTHSIETQTPLTGRPRSRRSYRWAIVFWLLSMLVGQGLGAGWDMRSQVEKDWSEHRLTLSPYDIWRSVRTFLCDNDDIRRYYAYTNALLGKPYYRYYVKTSESWRDEFKIGKTLNSKDVSLVVPEKPLVPYRDYLVEYPPGVFLVTVPPALLLPNGDYGDAYVKLFIAEMAVLLAAATVLALRLRRPLTPRDAVLQPSAAMMWFASGLGIFSLGTAAAHRFDPLVAFLLVALAWAAFEESWILFGALLSIAVLSKGIPLLLVPVWLFYAFVNHRLAGRGIPWREIGKALTGGTLCALPIVVPLYQYSGLSILDALRYHADRPLQVESTGSAVLGTLQAIVPGSLRTVFSFGSHNIVAADDRLAGLEWIFLRMQGPVVLLGMAALLFLAWRKILARLPSERPYVLPELTLRVICVVLVLYMVSGRVFSPQYLTWITPLGLFLSVRVSLRLSLLLVVTLALTHTIWRTMGLSFELFRPWAFFLLLLRNGMLLGWGLGLWLSPIPLRTQTDARRS